jgi:hypothetical protein
MLLVLPVGVRWVLFGPFIPGRSVSAGGHPAGAPITQLKPTPTSMSGMIQSTAHSLNEAVRKLHHTQTLQRVALTDPKVAMKWNGKRLTILSPSNRSSFALPVSLLYYAHWRR